MTGSVGILNVGAGDTKLTFDNSKPDEVAKSAAIVKDMIRRGFVLLIEVGSNEKGPIYQRAHDFDENTAEYIIAGVAEKQGNTNEQESSLPPRRSRKATPRRKATPQKRIPASSTKAVAIARTAGG